MTYQGVVLAAQARTASQLDTSRVVSLLNNALHSFWAPFPWEESLNKGFTFQLVNERETYKAPFVQIPSDFSRLEEAQITILTDSGHSREIPLHVLARKPLRPPYGIPEWISYDTRENGFRFDTIFKSDSSSSIYLIEYVYKKVPPILTRSDLDTDFFATRLEQPFISYLETFFLGSQARADVLAQIRQAILNRAAIEEGLLETPDFLEPALLWNEHSLF